MKLINTAPKDKVILLRLPEFGAAAESWWPGQWSHAAHAWAIRTPYTQDGKLVMVTDCPEPIGWTELPGYNAAGKATRQHENRTRNET